MNNEQQHTTGPWKTRDLGYQYIVGIGDCIPIYATDGSGLIAFVLKKDGGIENGRLIAAAPDLLEALKIALKQLQDLDDVLNEPNHEVIGWHLNGDGEPVSTFFEQNDHGAIEKARAAIAKATQPEQQPDYDNQAKDYEADQRFADAPTPYDP